MNTLWNELASRAGIELSAAQHEKLGRYLDLLFEANARMNLTRITDRAAAELQHIGDSLTVLPHLPAGAIRVADVGSGGGVPGIPLAIARPDATFLLIESTKKKAAFLKQAIETLELKNASVSEWRAEEVGHSNSRESFDVALARAVATLDWLAEWCLPLVKKGGKMLAMKGPKVVDELPAARRPIKLTGGGEAIVHPIALPGTEHRVIVEIPKIARADKRLPRPATQAKGKPIA
ncbi:MAG: rRNA (guanine527-N7)-methyltransferase [Phycisphaerales bacterium]|nr:rRNA (guanine527-N7)-methyltransferase [Phycisphaerales bacterium]